MKTGRLYLFGLKKVYKVKEKKITFLVQMSFYSNTNSKRSKPKITTLHIKGARAGRCWSRPRPLWEYPASGSAQRWARAAIIHYSWYCCRRLTMTRALSPQWGGSVMNQSLNQPLPLGRCVMVNNSLYLSKNVFIPLPQGVTIRNIATKLLSLIKYP